MPLDVSFACPDWEAKIAAGETPIAELPLDQERAGMAVRLFDGLRLPDVPGQPRLAEASGEWFRNIVRAAFAARDPETGRPLISEIFCLVPKKNSKTTYSAALGITALLMSERPNAEMLILGPTQNVADRCFRQARGMIKADQRLAKIFHVQDHTKTITRVKTGSTLRVKTFDMGVVTGEIPALTIIDELHVIASRSYADRVIGQITGGMVTNEEALLVYITTQSDVPPAGVFKTKLQYARGVRDGRITGGVRMLPVLYEFPERMQTDDSKPWRDPANWWMVTPNMGLSVNMDILRDQHEARREEGPESEAQWASQHLNIEIGLALHHERWIGADYWRENADPELGLEAILETSELVTIGADVGGADDLFGLAVIGRHAETRDWQVWVRAWCLDGALERRKEIAPQLRDFHTQGDLVITKTAAEHVVGAADICERVKLSGKMPDEHGIGLDPWGVAALLDELQARGMVDDPVQVSQGFKLSGAIKGLERRLFDGKLKHCGQPMMDWCLGNAKAELRGNNVYVTKSKAGTAKIDPLVAMFNAAVRMDANPVVTGTAPTPWDLDPDYRMAG